MHTSKLKDIGNFEVEAISHTIKFTNKTTKAEQIFVLFAVNHSNLEGVNEIAKEIFASDKFKR